MLEELYNRLNDEETARNVFDTDETCQTYKYFDEKYISPLYKTDWNKASEMSARFNDAVFTERKSAFMIGFKTAMQLTFEGMKK